MRARLFAPENRKWWTLVAVSFGLFMIMLDNTVVNVALPSIQRSLHVDRSELEWIVVGYALTFATFMLTGGKLADLLGRRLLFIVGLAIFTGASLACGLAPNAGFLIGALVGGLLTEKINWSWIFYINVPVGVLGIFMALWAIDETRDTSEVQRLDLPGLLTSGIGLFALTYALIEANNYGWTSARILSLFAVAAIAIVVFVALELRQRAPMLA